MWSYEWISEKHLISLDNCWTGRYVKVLTICALYALYVFKVPSWVHRSHQRCLENNLLVTNSWIEMIFLWNLLLIHLIGMFASFEFQFIFAFLVKLINYLHRSSKNYVRNRHKMHRKKSGLRLTLAHSRTHRFLSAANSWKITSSKNIKDSFSKSHKDDLHKK